MRTAGVVARIGLGLLILWAAPASASASPRSMLNHLLHRPAAATAKSAAEAPARDYASSWDEYQAMKAAAHGGTKKTWKTLPDWTGMWTHDGGFNFDPDQKGMNLTAQLTPEYAKRFQTKLDNVRKGIEWDPLSACLPAGFPRWLLEPFLREQIVRPEETWLVLEQNAEVRRIYTDGRGHVPDDEAYPMWEGDSIGFWDGDTLVVHTNNLRAGQYQRLQPEYSDKATSVERIRKIGPDTIEDRVVIYDPEALTRPWRVRHTFVRVKTPNLRINHWSCEENNNVVQTDTGSSSFKLPGESGYRDPNAVSQGPARPATPGGQ